MVKTFPRTARYRGKGQAFRRRDIAEAPQLVGLLRVYHEELRILALLDLRLHGG